MGFEKFVDENMIEKTKKECIHCNICKKNCDFLTKYDMNLFEFIEKPELRYSCFLCDKCRAVCPKDLSGAQIATEMRKESPKGTFKTEFMKNNYKLRNNSKKKSTDLLYLGCNFPGFLPKTSEKIIEICRELGMDYSIDCCKKPVYESGGKANISQVEKLCHDKGVKRLVCCCPNCYHFLKYRLDIEVIDIYKFLKEKGIGKKLDVVPDVFFPCSDRYNHEIFESVKYFIDDYNDTFTDVNCCGLGGGAGSKEPDLLEKTKEKMNAHNAESVYTYCSSCAGIFKNRYELKNVKNFLTEILEVKEEPSSSYGKNVLRFKFKNLRK